MIEEMSRPLLRLTDVSVTFDHFVLAPVSFEIGHGERVALVGPNGAGKSTIIKAIVGRLQEHRGTVEFNGATVHPQDPAVRTSIGLLPETLLGYGWMRVRQHFDFLSTFFPRWDMRYAHELASRLNVPLEGKLATLSRGERVKLMFVAAEAHRPPLLLLDEPTSGLDPLIRNELLRCIHECLAADPDRAVLFSTHILEDVESLAGRVLIISRGTLKADTTVERIRQWSGGNSVATAITNFLMENHEPTSSLRAHLG